MCVCACVQVRLTSARKDNNSKLTSNTYFFKANAKSGNCKQARQGKLYSHVNYTIYAYKLAEMGGQRGSEEGEEIKEY